MKKLKCWKKIKGTGDLTFKKGNKWIIIDKRPKYYSFETNLEGHKWRSFKSKPKALKFAKSYMKKHNIC